MFYVSVNGQGNIPFVTHRGAEAYREAIERRAEKEGIEVDVWIYEDKEDDGGEIGAGVSDTDS